ncbi:hypothetical protein COB18_00825 [Candidatus Kaiserbacteria bacterium]|nr:MAG: hypothetical protein COB18_00825 [Candidatus Kaiserbacteria bacterium]
MIFALLYLALPAFVANMMPVIFARMKIAKALDIPIDAGRTWRGKPLLGRNKTWRGVLAAVIGSLSVVCVQYYVALPLSITTSAYDTFWIACVYGVSVGILVMAGDALGSFLKRQCGVASGEPSIPLDQVDYIVLFVVGTLFFTSWTTVSILLLITITFFLNLVTNTIAYVTGIKNTYW